MTAGELRQYYTSEEFRDKYLYLGPGLGAGYTREKTVFRLWSPLSREVDLNLYQQGDSVPCFARVPMEPVGEGVWQAVVEGDLHGVYYDYRIRREGQCCTSADPYAKACGLNGIRSMVVDLARTDPPGWENDRAPAQEVEQIIYELHVKEFSWDPAGGFPQSVRGKYAAFLEEHITLNRDGVHPTGLDYLKELGITHVQLMPVFDFGSVDEGEGERDFNWGYDPVNYNIPEGSYATDARHGQVRIRELKEMVMALHRKGFRVIMDVVYNHTYSRDSWFQRTAPWYYYRLQEDGSPANGSGCGNDFASERKMCARYIRESVLYWAEEYHMDGFRFDLMGLLDTDLMNGIREDLDSRFGPGEKLVYGEPWAAGSSPMEGGHVPALKENIKKLHQDIGIFCDNTRDAVRGHVFDAHKPGFVNGGSGLEEEILCSVDAWCRKGTGLEAEAPSQIITYVSAHDNLTLWDKMVATMHLEGDYSHMYPDAVRACKLAAAICFTCQGRLFMLSGEEFARTKEGNENSYCSPIEVNRLDWGRAYRNEDILRYYQGLAALRRQLPGLCDKSPLAAGRIYRKRIEAEGTVSFCVHNQGEPGRWSELLVAYNSAGETRELELLPGVWEVLLDGENSRLWENPGTAVGSVPIKPVSALVLGRRE